MNLRCLCAAFSLGCVLSSIVVNAEQQPNTNPIYKQLRNLLPGGLPVTVNNLVLKKDAATFTFARGEIVFDPGGGGEFVDGRVIGGGHLWFPTIEIVRDLFNQSLFGAEGAVRFLQFNNGDGTFKLDSIDYSLGYIQRTPDHDARVADRPRPISIVVDARKSL